jgi:hypothetical protein
MGVVDLEIGGAGDAVEEIKARNAGLLTGDFTVVRTGDSASVRLTVDKVDRFADFGPQTAAVRKGLAAAARLLDLSPRLGRPPRTSEVP